jgi:hypothetical protein
MSAVNLTIEESSRVRYSVLSSTKFALSVAGALVVLVVAQAFLPLRWAYLAFDVAFAVTLGFAFFSLVNVSRAVRVSPWWVLTCATGAYLVAQIMLTGFRIEGAGAFPFPSVADGFFVSGQVLLIVGLLLMGAGYIRTQLPRGNALGYLAIIAASLLIGTLLWVFVVVPLWRSEQSAAFKVQMTTYIVLDVAMLTVAGMVMRLTAFFRGGDLAVGWAAVAIGCAAMAAGDALYALGTVAFVNGAFLVAYGAIAYGGLRHVETIDEILHQPPPRAT